MAERLQRQLQRLSPGHPSLLLPFDAYLVDILEDSISEVERARAAKQPVQDELTAKQQDKGQALKQRIHQKWIECRDCRNAFRKIASSRAQKAMRLLPADWDAEPIAPISLSVSDAIIYTSYEQGKKENDRLELQLWQLESRVNQMNAALAFENDPEQATHLALAAHDDLESLKRDIRPIVVACIKEVLRDMGLIPKPKSSSKRAA